MIFFSSIFIFITTFLLSFSNLATDSVGSDNIGIASEKKTLKINNEDRAITFHLSNNLGEIDVLLLLDGHGGDELVVEASACLEYQIKNYVEQISFNNVEEILQKIFEICAKETYSNIKGHSGATASLVYIFTSTEQSFVSWANIGDSPIIIGKEIGGKNIFQRVSEIHRITGPNSVKEWERIKFMLEAPPSKEELQEKWLKKKLMQISPKKRRREFDSGNRSVKKKFVRIDNIGAGAHSVTDSGKHNLNKKKHLFKAKYSQPTSSKLEQKHKQNGNLKLSFKGIVGPNPTRLSKSLNNLSKEHFILKKKKLRRSSSFPHELSWQEFMVTIENPEEWACETSIEVTRAFGNLENRRWGVITEPFTGKQLLTGNEIFVAIVSDGISDPYEKNDKNYSEEIGKIIFDGICRSRSVQQIADQIVLESVLEGSPNLLYKNELPSHKLKDDSSIVLLLFPRN